MNLWNTLKHYEYHVRRRDTCECKDDCERPAEHGHHGLATRTSNRKRKKVVDQAINMQMLNNDCHEKKGRTPDNTLFFLSLQILRYGKQAVIDYLQSVYDVGYQKHRMAWLLRETKEF